MPAFAFPVSSPPAGWYDDPQGLPNQRWWSGSSWTDQIAATSEISAMRVDGNDPAQSSALPTSIESSPIPAGITYPAPSMTSNTRVARSTPALSSVPTRLSIDMPEPHSAVENLAPPVLAPAPVLAPVPVLAPTPVDTSVATPVPSSVPTPAPEPVPVVNSVPVVNPVPVVSPVPVVNPVPAVNAVPVAAPTPAHTPASALLSGFPGTTTLALSGSAPTAWDTPRPPAAPASGAATEAPFEVAYTPFASSPRVESGYAGAPIRTHTASAWLLSILPLICGASLVLAAQELGEFYTSFVAMGAVLVFVLIMFSLGLRDSRELRAAGYRRAPSPGWLILSPIAYLGARFATTKRELGTGSGPFVVSLVVAAVVAVITLLAPELVDLVFAA